VTGAALPDDALLSTVHGVVQELYHRVSFAPGAAPDWEGLRALFAPDARLLPPPHDPSTHKSVDFDGWMRESSAALEHGAQRGIRDRGFVEREIGARVEQFGGVAHVTSAYASWFADAADAPGAAPFARGVNSVQLVRRAGRWWVASLAWDVERPDAPLPASLLGDA
jgi:hypothetical protein